MKVRTLSNEPAHISHWPDAGATESCNVDIIADTGVGQDPLLPVADDLDFGMNTITVLIICLQEVHDRAHIVSVTSPSWCC